VEPLEIAWENIVKICRGSNGNAEYHETVTANLTLITQALKEYHTLKKEAAPLVLLDSKLEKGAKKTAEKSLKKEEPKTDVN
jgi:hypothetical protein